MRHFHFAPALFLMLSCLALPAQEAPLFNLEAWVRNPMGFVPQGLSCLQWQVEGDSFSWVRTGANGPELVVSNAEGTSETVVLNGQELAAALATVMPGIGADALANLRWEAGARTLLLDHPAGLVRVTLAQAVGSVAGDAAATAPANGIAAEVLFRLPQGAEHAVYAANKSAVAFVLDHNVHVLLQDSTTHAATEGGNADLTHGIEVHRVEFGIHDGLWFSPDGTRVAFYREDFKPVDAYPYFEIGSLPAKAKAGRYPMAGRNSSVVSVGVHEIATGKTQWLALDSVADEWHTNVAWSKDSSEVWIAHVNRAQSRMELRAWNAASGALRGVVLVEEDAEWIEPESPPLFVPGGAGSFLWLSVRNGFRHVHLFDAAGKHQRQITKGTFDVQEFLGFDADGKGFQFSASGENPLHKHLFHATLEGQQHQLTLGRGHHSALRSANGKWLLDTHTNLELPKAVDVVALNKDVDPRRLYTAPDPFAGFRHGRDELFTCTAADGATLHGWMMLPPEGMLLKGAPVVHYVYGGPHSQLVTDQWLSGGGRWNLWLATMASQGHVVFFADGRGTLQRGIDWQQTVHRKLGTQELSDQLAVLDYVLLRTEASSARVGVVGWSFGGFMTLTLMTRAGERYKAGIAGAPVTDWGYYETGYGERYMDTPAENPAGYKEANPSSHVKGLRGRLLVVHGSADDTVVWQNTLSFLKACIDNSVEVETMIYPGELHGLRGRSMLHFLRKASTYFKSSL
ncbi:MAG: S9 family peptidase [Planctomycetes bacterium]|nr:S9 family peptidase [Planctomycetota bacterium]